MKRIKTTRKKKCHLKVNELKISVNVPWVCLNAGTAEELSGVPEVTSCVERTAALGREEHPGL